MLTKPLMKVLKCLALIVMGLVLVSCSDESKETLTLPEDMHANERAIATAEYDRGDSRWRALGVKSLRQNQPRVSDNVSTAVRLA